MPDSTAIYFGKAEPCSSASPLDNRTHLLIVEEGAEGYGERAPTARAAVVQSVAHGWLAERCRQILRTDRSRRPPIFSSFNRRVATWAVAKEVRLSLMVARKHHVAA